MQNFSTHFKRTARLIATLTAALLLAGFAIGGCQGSGLQGGGTQGGTANSGASAAASPDAGTATEDSTAADNAAASSTAATAVTEDGSYTTKDEVAAYIHEFGHLPSNFVTKKEARAAGWDSKSNYVGDVLPGKSIGGDYFGNYDELLPDARGRSWTECDIDYQGKKRGPKRIVFSNDGLIYYTEDHYESFEQLY